MPSHGLREIRFTFVTMHDMARQFIQTLDMNTFIYLWEIMSHKSYPTYSVLSTVLWCCKNKSYRIAYKKMNFLYQWPADSLKITKAPMFWMIFLHSLKCLLAVELIILWSCLIIIKYMRKQYHFGEAAFKKLKYTVPFVFESTDSKWVASATSVCLWQVLIMFGCSNRIRLLLPNQTK